MLDSRSSCPCVFMTRLSENLIISLIYCFFLVGIGGCSAARWEVPSPEVSDPPPTSVGVAQVTLQQLLGDVFVNWQGTPYLYGGNSRNGIDCSAFSQRAITKVYGIELPRTTTAQMNVGYSVDRNQVGAGDLVFFKTGVKLHHVGVMMDHVKFMHASTSQGVTLSRLDDSYWRSRLLDVRRIN